MSIEQTAIDESQLYQRGFGLKKEVKDILKREYFSHLVSYLREKNFTLNTEQVTIHLAKEFGFCYGVDRAVDYAYQTKEKFPDKRIFITGEIIHNPHVNKRLINMGIHFLSGQYANGIGHDNLSAEDVVILPAFGVSIQEFERLKASDCIMVDTTCGSVLNVWKRVGYYAKNGYTSVIHGKYYHEESIATSSQALKYSDGKFLIVRDMEEAKMVCDYIKDGGDRQAFLEYFKKAVSPGFNPDKDLQKVGVANQTTMLSNESLAIAGELGKALEHRFGSENLDAYFQTFDTICSATQERQDAVLDLVNEHKLDVMLVVGGFNSSNTTHLAVLTSKYTTTYHIEDPSGIFETGAIRHKRVSDLEIVKEERWLPEKPFTLGITAGASTPNNKIGETIEKVMRLKGVDLAAIIAD